MRYKLLPVFVFMIFMPALSFAAEKLIFAVDLIRHGDRTPIETIPKVDYQWTQGLGQLTATGMRQEHELGRQFRKRYIEQTHLLPPHYQHGTMYVRSTDYERTLMSAQSLLTGLYPMGTGPYIADSGKPGLPRALQPIPIHTWPREFDNIILHKINPEERERLMQKYVYSTVEWQKREAALKMNFQRWSEITGLRISRLDDLERLGDTLHIHQLHHAPMPAGMSAEEIQTIMETGDWVFMAEERPKEVGNVYSRRLLSYIAGYLQNGSKQDERLKYVLLSAHDSTIASALSFMGAPLDTSPRYASNLNFSLYENGARNYIVKITYNGSPVVIPACGGTVCPLSKFIEISQTII